MDMILINTAKIDMIMEQREPEVVITCRIPESEQIDAINLEDKCLMDSTTDISKERSCYLCQKTRILQKSHIIPRFIGKWIKDTSATGYMANAQNASERIQDTQTMYLLCSDCEEKFSGLERYFSNELFTPFHKNDKKSFTYDHQLETFIISVNWRVLMYYYKPLLSRYPILSDILDPTNLEWRSFLLGERKTITPYENHLIFLDHMKPEIRSLPKFSWYLRGVGQGLHLTDDTIFVYAKLPNMMLVSSILPTVLEGWNKTKINTNGTIDTNQIIRDKVFDKFVRESVYEAVNSSSGPTQEVTKKRLEKALRNPQKFFGSETIPSMISDRNFELHKKAIKLPLKVRLLIEEIIIRAVDNPLLSKAENQENQLKSRMMANKIADLSDKELLELEQGICNAIRLSNDNKTDEQFTLKTHSIWIIFMISQNNVEYRREQIKQKINNIEHECIDLKVPTAIFSINLVDQESYESAFLIPQN